MNYKLVEMTDGVKVKVFPPPTIQIEALLNKKYPTPDPPTVTDKTASGKEVTMSIDDDPTYLAKVKEIDEARQAEREDLHYLFALRDVVPPDDFDVDLLMGEEIRYMNPDWKPRQGKTGRKLDYIEWVVMGDMVNATRIGQALSELISVNLEVVAQVEKSF